MTLSTLLPELGYLRLRGELDQVVLRERVVLRRVGRGEAGLVLRDTQTTKRDDSEHRNECQQNAYTYNSSVSQPGVGASTSELRTNSNETLGNIEHKGVYFVGTQQRTAIHVHIFPTTPEQTTTNKPIPYLIHDNNHVHIYPPTTTHKLRAGMDDYKV